MNKSGKSSPTQTQTMVDDPMKVRILVVDDDNICLAITASVLKLFNYQVVTINCPLEALSALRMNQDTFDIILSDVHMPLMNGLNFQRIVEIEFHIPVILMSADDKKNLLLKSLENGAAFFIVKPPSINDLKNIWQYVISRRKGAKDNNVEPSNNNGIVNTNPDDNNIYRRTPPLYANNESELQKQPSVVENVENNNIEGKITSSNPKKPKLIWTTALHNKFLEAISVIGTSRAVPKKILEYMNVPGLTRENIASHLQKYRIYVRRLNDSNGSMQHGMPMNWNERPFRSSFSWSQFPSLANNSFLLKYSNAINHNQQQERTSLPNYNSQQNSFLQSNNNLFSQPSIMNMNYNNLTRPMNILESSIFDTQNNKVYGDEDDSVSAAIQFVTPKLDPYSNNIERNNRGRGILGLNNEYMRPHIMTSHTSHGARNNRLMGSLSSQERGFDNVGPSVNLTAPLLGMMKHNNNNVVENNFNIPSNTNNDQMSVTNVNIIANDQPVTGTRTSELNIESMPNLNNIASASGELENMNNVSAGQVIAGNNNVNANLQRRNAHDKDVSTINFTGGSSAPLQDWAPNQLDDHFSMEYGIEDLSTIFSNIDGPNGNNNKCM